MASVAGQFFAFHLLASVVFRDRNYVTVVNTLISAIASTIKDLLWEVGGVSGAMWHFTHDTSRKIDFHLARVSFKIARIDWSKRCAQSWLDR